MSNKPSVKKGKSITVFTLMMLNVAAILSLRNLPSTAEYGLSSAFFWVVAAVTFFIPVALVSAELATGWPKNGGVYVWVKEAFGPTWGFVASWLYWIENVVWFPTVLSFTAATIAFIFDPQLAENKIFMLVTILIVFWLGTFINFLGMRTSSIISSLGVLLGTILPGLLIVVLGIAWPIIGRHSQIAFNSKNLIPDFSNIGNIVFAAGTILAFAGMELSAVHAQDVKNPQRDYPKAIFSATGIILLIYIIGTLAISIVVPENKISLVAGLMQAFQAFFTEFNIGWAVPIIAALTAIGALALVNTWIIGPAKALLATAQNGDLPAFMQTTNENGAPTGILWLQGIVGSGLAFLFVLMPSVSSSYWILTALTTQLYVILYLLMFAAAIRLRYTRPLVPRAYRVPGGRIGMWMIAGLGILSSAFTFFIGFFPPSQMPIGSLVFYELFLLLGCILFVGAPFLIHTVRSNSHTPDRSVIHES